VISASTCCSHRQRLARAPSNVSYVHLSRKAEFISVIVPCQALSVFRCNGGWISGKKYEAWTIGANTERNTEWPTAIRTRRASCRGKPGQSGNPSGTRFGTFCFTAPRRRVRFSWLPWPPACGGNPACIGVTFASSKRKTLAIQQRMRRHITTVPGDVMGNRFAAPTWGFQTDPLRPIAGGLEEHDEPRKRATALGRGCVEEHG